ncbi:hypothetical protein [Amycolatopsis coloradensis]|nr:hypothetical protein [Amycolatopsis coloradensis]
MRSFRRSFFAVLVAVATLFGTALPATAAEDHKAVDLPIARFSDILVDPGLGHVFVSSSEENTVVVTDLTGTVVTKLENLQGAGGLALSPDGDTVFVALSLDGAIAAIDTLTLEETARHSVGWLCPSTLSITGNMLYFGYGCEIWREGNVGSAVIGPVFGDVKTGLLPRNESTVPLVATSPARPDLFATGIPDVSPTRLKIHQVSGDTVTERASTWTGGYVRDLEMSTDGSLLYAATSGPPYQLRTFTTDNLAERQAYRLNAYPGAVAVSRDTSALAAGATSTDAQDVFTYRNGSYSPSRQYDFATLQANRKLLAPGGLAWGPGGKWLYAATFDHDIPGVTLNILRA